MKEPRSVAEVPQWASGVEDVSSEGEYCLILLKLEYICTFPVPTSLAARPLE